MVAPVVVLSTSNLPISKGCHRDLPFVAENTTSGIGLKSSVLTLVLANYLLSYFAILRLLERLALVLFTITAYQAWPLEFVSWIGACARSHAEGAGITKHHDIVMNKDE